MNRWQPMRARLEAELPVPYPERAQFLDELCGDLDALHTELLGQGLDDAAATVEVERRVASDLTALQGLQQVHLPTVQRALARLSPASRSLVEAVAVGLPLVVMLVFLGWSLPLAHFLREGGGAMAPVVVVGLTALLLEFERALTWFVLRDHSAAALAKNTSSPLLLAAAAAVLGLMGTALGAYVVLFRASQGPADPALLVVGLRESLSCLVVGTALCGLVVLLHAVLQAGLRLWRVPGP